MINNNVCHKDMQVRDENIYNSTHLHHHLLLNFTRKIKEIRREKKNIFELKMDKESGFWELKKTAMDVY
jgi:hypothetical protein